MSFAAVCARPSSSHSQNKLTTGSTIAVGNSSGKATTFKVVGIVSEPAGDNPSQAEAELAAGAPAGAAGAEVVASAGVPEPAPSAAPGRPATR